MCQSHIPKALAEFYQTIGVPVYVQGEDYHGWNLGNPENGGSVCVWDENQWGKASAGCITISRGPKSAEGLYAAEYFP